MLFKGQNNVPKNLSQSRRDILGGFFIVWTNLNNSFSYHELKHSKDLAMAEYATGSREDSSGSDYDSTPEGMEIELSSRVNKIKDKTSMAKKSSSTSTKANPS